MIEQMRENLCVEVLVGSSGKNQHSLCSCGSRPKMILTLWPYAEPFFVPLTRYHRCKGIFGLTTTREHEDTDDHTAFAERNRPIRAVDKSEAFGQCQYLFIVSDDSFIRLQTSAILCLLSVD